ncbi:hypothetical protein [Limnohabitans sp.]|uniref:hypothetical protein n=1 Tax=Limnohabitans sp. TaxID=1907725 RepID=UPI00334130E9
MSDREHLERLRHHVEAALEYSGGTHDFDDIVEMVGKNQLQVWPATQSIVLTEIIVYPRLKNLHYFLAGGDLDELSRMRPMIESWGKSLGCTRVSLAGRRGWSKTFLKDEGYSPQWTVLAKKL